MGRVATSADVEKQLRRLGSQTKAKKSSWFFKTEKGNYGYGDVFYGVSVPEQRKVSKEFQDLELSHIERLLASKYHECRATGLFILTNQFKKAAKQQRKVIFDFYMTNRARVNNWDLVDGSAPIIVGLYLLDKNKEILYSLAKSTNLWDKRIAIISTFGFIKNDEFEDTVKISTVLLHDEHDLIHKAVGWMLREAGKRNKKVLIEFLDQHSNEMPRTMLRYSIEKLSDSERKKYMRMKSAKI